MTIQPNYYVDAYGNPYPYQPGMYPVDRGFGYAPRPQPKRVQPLTQEQIQKLKQGSNGFDWKVSEEDVLRAICTHREKNGSNALVETPEGLWHCTICGATFRSKGRSLEEVTEATNTIIDFLQTAKSMYLDAPDNLISQYFQVIPILEKLPVLYSKALENYTYYEGNPTTAIPISGVNYQDGFQMLNNMLAYNPAQYGVPGQNIGYPPNGYDPAQPHQYYNNGYPVGGYAPQQMDGQVPPWNNGYPNGYAQQPMNYSNPGPNPFMYNGQPAPAPGVMPPVQQSNNVQTQAGNVPPSAPPVQQTGNNEVTQQKNFNV